MGRWASSPLCDRISGSLFSRNPAQPSHPAVHLPSRDGKGALPPSPSFVSNSGAGCLPHLSSSSIHHPHARGAFHTSLISEDLNNYSFASHSRHLFEDNESRAQTSVDLAEGYMTNADLERAIEEFGQKMQQHV